MQGDAFSRAVLEDSEVPVPLEEAIANMAVIEAIFNSAETGQWEKPTSLEAKNVAESQTNHESIWCAGSHFSYVPKR